MPQVAQAENAHKYYLQVGFGLIELQDSFDDFVLGGQSIAASAAIGDPRSVFITAGYKFRPDWSLSATFAVAEEARVVATGDFSGLGELGRVTTGAIGLHLNRHFNTDGQVQPFVGVGLTQGLLFDSESGSLAEVTVSGGTGIELRGGFDYFFDDRIGAYLTVSKSVVAFDVEGTARTFFFSRPLSATANVNPVSVHAGLSLRF